MNVIDIELITRDIFDSNDISIEDEDYDKDKMVELINNIYCHANDLDSNNAILLSNLKDTINIILDKKLCVLSPKYNESELLLLESKIKYLETIPQPEQRTPEWYVFRNERLTASDLLYAIDCSNKKRTEIIKKKCGYNPPFTPGQAILHGIKYEPIATEIYEGRNNLKIMEFGCLPHPHIPFFGASPEVMEAAIKENKKIGLRSTAHHAQLNVVKWNVLNSARAGLTSMEHWYGLPEALFNNRIIQNYPPNYNYQNEQHRFEEAGKLWAQAAEPFSDHWNNVMNELISLDFTISPTLNIYEASRDLHRARRAEWHDDYTLPSLWGFYAPSRISHGSYWHYWGTEQEVAWKENYRLWMIFLNEFKNRGGRVTVGSDSGFIYQLYGFAYVRELELLREAGFHPLEVIQSATLNGAETLGIEKFTGSVEVGKFADLIVIDENPLENLKVLYGTGAIKLDDDNNVTRVGGVKYTIKDGIVYDAKKLLKEVKNMVDLAKKEAGYKIKQPGIE